MSSAGPGANDGRGRAAPLFESATESPVPPAWLDRQPPKVRAVTFGAYDPDKPGAAAPKLQTIAPPAADVVSRAARKNTKQSHAKDGAEEGRRRADMNVVPPPPPTPREPSEPSDDLVMGGAAAVAPDAPRHAPSFSHAPYASAGTIGAPVSGSMPAPRVSKSAPPPRLPGTPPPGSMSKMPPPSTELAEALSAKIEAFAEAAADLGTARARILSEIEGPLLELAVHVAEAIIERELERDPDLHGALARAALEALGDSRGAVLRASREAYAAILEVYATPYVSKDGMHVEVKLDASLEGLGCVAENPDARVDARLPERLRTIRRALDDERRRRAMEVPE